ncbi:hypothetical protein B0T10DRAFT_413299 [Thelonectria olida]|uniref:C2H2-type domain-containing protein n=1 Tax=Thelonectria olida TaxID=1576542 RepID=A0A9P8VWL6_9HYPO|nr:hypothetical protein B0T10DRAFT_413299 [Thelonectria olida]
MARYIILSCRGKRCPHRSTQPSQNRSSTIRVYQLSYTPLDNEISRVHTDLASVGTKRRRPDQSQGSVRRHACHICRTQGSPPYVTLVSSDSECGESDSGNDLDSDDSWETEDSWETDDPWGSESPEENEDQDLREGSLQFSYPKLKASMDAAQYGPPPNHRQLSLRKRSRTSNWASHSPCHEDEAYQSDSESADVSSESGCYHFGCPFYFSDPEKYHKCLMNHDLRSARDTRRHVQLYHMKPLYCPMCYETFTMVRDRDMHISKRSCNMCDEREVDGINEYQRARLSKRDMPCLSETARWKRIWDTIFPNREAPRSPYLTDNCGLAVSKARDYWRQYGASCVSQYLGSLGLLGRRREGDGKAEVALVKLTLKDLLSQIAAEHRPVKDSNSHTE